MKEKTSKMIFAEEKFYNDQNVPLYNRGVVYEVEECMVGRWLKRGGKLVADLGTEELNAMIALSHPQEEAKEEKPKASTYREHQEQWESKAEKKEAAKAQADEKVEQVDESGDNKETEAEAEVDTEKQPEDKPSHHKPKHGGKNHGHGGKNKNK